MDQSARQDFTGFVAARSRQLTRLALRDALLALPPRRRAVLVLRYLEDLPESQVAEILGCSVGTVRSQNHKAVAQLRLALPSLGLTSTDTRLESARVQRGPGGHQYQIDIRLTPADARRFATLTGELAGQHSPRNQLAIVTNGHVLADQVVMTAITAGQAAIPGFASWPQAEFFLHTLIGY